MDKTKRIRELIDILNKDTYAYDKGTPELTENQWNEMYFELQALEASTGIYFPDSPTQNIYYDKVSSLKEITHDHPMLSLDKTKSIDALKDFINNQPYISMMKMDGLTCSLTYNNGYLIRAETRGNGLVGEDILHNAMVIPSIPKRIDYAGRLVVDGEIICKLDDFREFSNEYKNSRNFAAGSVRLLDSKECQKRKLTFVAWDIISGIENLPTLTTKLNTLKALCFTVVPFKNSSDSSEIEDIIWNLNELSFLKDYPIDGIVVKYDNCEYYEKQGRTNHHFRGGIAFKFRDELFDTKLIDIDWTIGRTGIITPVAIFETVEIDGCEVSRASLHNLSIMKNLLDRPYTTQALKVYKAHQINPQVYSAEKETEKTVRYLDIPKTCPICGEPTSIQKDNDSEFLVCENPNCEGQLINELDHFVGKKGLDIRGLSKATLSKLIDWNWVNSKYDIFTLVNHKEEWSKKVGFGAKSVDNILNAINESRNCELAEFIAALGIPLIGTTNAKDLAKKFGAWDNFIAAINDKKDFSTLPNFGDAKNYSLLNFDFSEAVKIATEFMNIKDFVSNDSSPIFEGKVFVITGKLQNYKNRVELKGVIESLGGKVVDSISSKTTYLINNDINSTSSKNKKAKELNIPIITEEEFEKSMLKDV